MRRRAAVMTAVLLLVGLLPVGSAAADDDDGGDGVYISLGDSLAAGTQANEGIVTDDSYTDVLFKRLRDDLDLGTHVKLGCPGETSGSLNAGGCPFEAALNGGAGYLTGTQLGDAMLAIAAAGPDLELITIDIGANDVLGCLSDLQGQPDLNSCIANVALPGIASNLTFTLAALQAAAPGVPIVGMNYYNPNLAWVLDDANAPFPGFGLASQGLTVAVNDLLAATYAGAFGGGAVAPVPMTDVAKAFRTFNDKKNVKTVCKLTLMCEKSHGELVMSDWDPAPGPQPDIHANDKGYRKIAKAFQKTMKQAGIIDD